LPSVPAEGLGDRQQEHGKTLAEPAAESGQQETHGKDGEGGKAGLAKAARLALCCRLFVHVLVELDFSRGRAPRFPSVTTRS
jgi:hypothetical protein